jgi:hypothetical protein
MMTGRCTTGVGASPASRIIDNSSHSTTARHGYRTVTTGNRNPPWHVGDRCRWRVRDSVQFEDW